MTEFSRRALMRWFVGGAAAITAAPGLLEARRPEPSVLGLDTGMDLLGATVVAYIGYNSGSVRAVQCRLSRTATGWFAAETDQLEFTERIQVSHVRMVLWLDDHKMLDQTETRHDVVQQGNTLTIHWPLQVSFI